MVDFNPFMQYGPLENTSFQHQYQADRMMNMFARNDRLDMAHQNFRSPHGASGLGGNPMLAQMLSGDANQPNLSQFTYNPQMKAAAESAGVHPLEASQVNPNAFLPNTGFFGNHPRLSRMLEGGIFGAAATRGSDTLGEGISNVAGGLLEGRMARQGMINRQFETPFQNASMLESLADRKQERELKEADIQHLRAENQRLGRPDHDFRAFGVSRNDPDIATIDNTSGELKLTPNPMYDPKSAALATGGEWGSYLQDMQHRNPNMTVQDIVKQHAKDHQAPERDQQALEWVKQSDGSMKLMEMRPGATIPGGGPIPVTPSQAGAAAGKEQARTDKLAKARQDYINKQSKDNEFLLRNFGKTVLDKGVEKQVGDYYDQTIAPYINPAQESSSQ